MGSADEPHLAVSLGLGVPLEQVDGKFRGFIIAFKHYLFDHVGNSVYGFVIDGLDKEVGLGWCFSTYVEVDVVVLEPFLSGGLVRNDVLGLFDHGCKSLFFVYD